MENFIFVFLATVYVGELVSSEWRGAFGSALGFSMSLGLQYVILVTNSQIILMATILKIARPFFEFFSSYWSNGLAFFVMVI
jgi:hypothetical protein